uniref:Beta-chimaerin n=1 Tax=Strongyloides venezuelensis TaxID=75913 RepID=A0A0K0G1K7_STRVS
MSEFYPRSVISNEFGDDSISADGYWKHNLLVLQEKAPKPICVPCRKFIANKPEQYGHEYHGLIERKEAEKLLRESGEGSYLVRASKRSVNANTLCIFFDNQVLHYMLYYDGNHYLGEKRFESLELMVADGLISMFLEKNASEYIRKMAEEAVYEHSPYLIYQRAANNISSDGPVVVGDFTNRPHNFSSFTFKMPHYCDYCRNFMWGLVQQGVKCNDCGFAAHKKCSERAYHDCRPEAKYVKRMFAVDLTTLCLAHNVSIAPVFKQCIDEVERRGLHIEGIYRVSASHEQMDRLRKQYDTNPNSVNLSEVDDIHTVAGLLKLYLRLLPQQLVPFSNFQMLCDAYGMSQNPSERALHIKKALKKLEKWNCYTLDALLNHLRKVAEYSDKNKMNVANIATIFAPTVFCAGTIPSLPQHQHLLLDFLIKTPGIVPYV